LFLKKLVLSGFKSFVGKTAFNFSRGINAVVGPNGCGKSNILDAIRWVLGEQRTTVLRSKQMDEMIFAGTGRIKPAGMAQVTLILDNANGKFPSDQPEVSICRRIFRGGGGQYFLNRKSTRLKDIQESIADTGIGQGAFFILSAREVEQVLSPNSDDRRAILEETAGINKYQLRKKETLRKLSATRENIARLNDILQEVGRQVAMSEKQLRQLNRYKSVRERLSKLECSVVLKEREKIDLEEAELSKKIKSVEQERQNIEIELERIKFEIYTQEKMRRRVSASLEREREEYSQKSREEGEVSRAIDLTSDRILRAKESLVEYGKNKDKLHTRIKQLKENIEKNREEAKEEDVAVSKLEAQFREAFNEFKTCEENYRKIRQKIEEMGKVRDSIREELGIVRVKAGHENAVRESAILEKDENKKRALKLIEELEESHGKLSSGEQELEDLEKKREEISAESSKLDNEFKKIYDKAAGEDRKRRGLKESLHSMRSEIAVLEREEENFRGFSEAFQRIMKNQKRLPSLTPVHKIIRVDERYETAIDVALGVHFQSIITKDRKDAGACIDFLKRERAGRLTFFPLDLDHSGKSLPSIDMKAPGIVDWARNLVQCEPLYRDILDMICRKALVVENLEAAYKLYDRWKRERSFIPRLVTLDGDVLDFSGAVTGGKFRADRSKLLSRQRRRREIEKEERKNAIELDESNKRISQIENSINRIAGLRKLKSEKLGQLNREIQNISGQLDVFRRLRKTANEDLSRIEKSEEKIRSRIDNHKKIQYELEEKIKSLEKSLSSRNDQIDSFEETHKGRLNELEDMKKSVDNLDRRTDEARHQKRMLEIKIESDSKYLIQMEPDMDNLDIKIKNREKELLNLESNLQDIKNSRSILNMKLKSYRRAIESSRKDLASADNDMEKSREKLAQISGRKSGTDELFNNLRIKRIEIESRRSYLRDRLTEFNKETKKAAKRIQMNHKRITEEIEKTRNRLLSFDTVNFSAEEEFNEHKKRFNELKSQVDDLQESASGLRKIIREMDTVSIRALDETLVLVNERFSDLFKKVFGGGRAGVLFSDPENKLESGIDITIKLPGKRATNINLLSSGEKSLTAVTFLFSILSIKPGPFVILDELDAPLDDSNVEKIAALIQEFSKKSQFIVITHNRKTMEFSDTMFGVTMEEAGVSKLVSVKLNEMEKNNKDEKKK